MALSARKDLRKDERLDQLRESLFGYLGEMDAIKPSTQTIFRTLNSKVDLETKVWHHHHKIEATSYHCQRIGHLTAIARKDLKNMMDSVGNRPTNGESETRIALQDRKILYEVDAFFVAARSSLDFLASIISRYIQGKDTDKFVKLPKFLHGSTHPIASLVNDSWNAWVKNFIDYRDYLLHSGVLPTPSGVYVKINGSKIRDPAVEILETLLQREHGGAIIFPLPIEPSPRVRLTREEIFGLNKPELPMGIIETSTTVTLSSEKSEGPKIKVSLGRSLGSNSIDVTSESYLGKQSSNVRSIQYKLAPGYVEANTLCQDFYNKLVELSIKIFSQLAKAGFAHIA